MKFSICGVVFVIYGVLSVVASLTDNRRLMSFLNPRAIRRGWIEAGWYRIYQLVTGILLLLLGIWALLE